jgi:hypothetical protein
MAVGLRLSLIAHQTFVPRSSSRALIGVAAEIVADEGV